MTFGAVATWGAEELYVASVEAATRLRCAPGASIDPRCGVGRLGAPCCWDRGDFWDGRTIFRTATELNG